MAYHTTSAQAETNGNGTFGNRMILQMDCEQFAKFDYETHWELLSSNPFFSVNS